MVSVLSKGCIELDKNWKILFFVLSVITLSAFAVGEYAELEQLMNARAEADFRPTSGDNIRFQLPPGSVGKIQQIKKMPSGNYGLQVELQNNKAGESAWIYYTPQKPNMKFLAATAPKGQLADPTGRLPKLATTKMETATHVQITRATAAVSSPKPVASPLLKESVAAVVKSIESANATHSGADVGAAKGCSTCAVSAAGQGGTFQQVIQIGSSTDQVQAKVHCKSKGGAGAFASSLDFEIENGKVSQFAASIKDCSVNLTDGFTVKTSNGVILKDPTGCTFVITQDFGPYASRGTNPMSLQFGAVDDTCEKRCPKSTKLFWQVHITPQGCE